MCGWRAPIRRWRDLPVPSRRSEQPLGPEADMSFASDDDMIMESDADTFERIGDVPRNGDILPAGRWITARMIVGDDDCGRAEIEGTSHHFAHIDRRLVYRTLAHQFVADQPVAAIEVQDMHAFVEPESHVCTQIVEQALPAAEDRAVCDLAIQGALDGSLDQFDRCNAGFAHVGKTGQGFGVSLHQRAESAEFPQQRLGNRFGVNTRPSEREQIFEDFMIAQRVAACSQQPCAQPCAVPRVIAAGGLFSGGCTVAGHGVRIA